jgi:hypothetical protein
MQIEKNKNNIIQKNQSLITECLLYLIPLTCGLIYWLAFFPGVMSFDSVSQWNQLTIFKIENSHPAINTILMWLLTRIWYSPAIISLFQVVIASLVIGYGLNSIRKTSRLSGILFIALGFIISANPLVGIMDVTLWKDVLYSFLVLLASIFIFNIVSSNGEWIKNPKGFILLGITFAGIWLFRFNGFPIVIASLIALVLIYKRNIRYFVYSSLITLSLLIFISEPLYSWFKVNRAIKFNYGIALIHPIVAYVNSKLDLAYLTDEEKQYLNQIYPLDNEWAYSCYDATVFFYNNTNFMPVMKDPLMMLNIFLKLAMRNPGVMIKHYLCLSSFVWQLKQPNNVYMETILLDNYNPDQRPAWEKYTDIVTQNPLLPTVSVFIKRIVWAEWRRDIYRLIWRPAIYMYSFLVSLAFLTYRTKRKEWLLLSIPLLFQTIGIMLTTQLQALRYQYPVYLISMLFTVPLFIMGIKSPLIKQRTPNNQEKNNYDVSVSH